MHVQLAMCVNSQVSEYWLFRQGTTSIRKWYEYGKGIYIHTFAWFRCVPGTYGGHVSWIRSDEWMTPYYTMRTKVPIVSDFVCGRNIKCPKLVGIGFIVSNQHKCYVIGCNMCTHIVDIK